VLYNVQRVVDTTLYRSRTLHSSWSLVRTACSVHAAVRRRRTVYWWCLVVSAKEAQQSEADAEDIVLSTLPFKIQAQEQHEQRQVISKPAATVAARSSCGKSSYNIGIEGAPTPEDLEAHTQLDSVDALVGAADGMRSIFLPCTFSATLNSQSWPWFEHRYLAET
jgi:hypothetical protein